MENIKRSFDIKVNLMNGTIIEKPKIFYYNTDMNTSYINVMFYNTDEITDETELANLDNLKITMNILKPNLVDGTVKGTIENNIAKFKLSNDLIKAQGTYKIEFLIEDTTLEEKTIITSESLKYLVKTSILSDMNEPIEKDDNYPILLELIEEVNKIKFEVTLKYDEETESFNINSSTFKYDEETESINI